MWEVGGWKRARSKAGLMDLGGDRCKEARWRIERIEGVGCKRSRAAREHGPLSADVGQVQKRGASWVARPDWPEGSRFGRHAPGKSSQPANKKSGKRAFLCAICSCLTERPRSAPIFASPQIRVRV